MKKHSITALILSLLFCAGAFAQTDLTGIWQGKLAVSPNEKMTVQFVFTKQPDGLYTVVLNSPDSGGIKNVPATGVKLAGNIVTIDVASLSGSYSGTVVKGVITGEWKQSGSTLPLVLTPYKTPPVSSLKPLVGDWIGKLSQQPGGEGVTAVFHFEISKDGKFNASVSIPDQGQSGIPVSDVVLERDEVSFKIAGGAADYAGKLIGNKIDGAFKQGGAEIKLNLTRGKYEAPAYVIPAEGIKRLAGAWSGNSGPNKLMIVFRFEKAPGGKLAVFMDVPIQGARGVIARDFTLQGDEITIKLPGASGDIYKGQISGSSIKGIFKLNNVDQELNLVRKEASPIDGTWKGATPGPDGKPLDVTYLFEAYDKTLVGTVTTTLGGGPFSEGKVEGNNFSFVVRTDQFTINTNGTLAGDVIQITQKNADAVTKFSIKRVAPAK